MKKPNEKYIELVEELVKNEPNQKKIKELMELQGLPYTKDPIMQMSTVLQAINTTSETNKEMVST